MRVEGEQPQEGWESAELSNTGAAPAQEGEAGDTPGGVKTRIEV